jgi:hypothetical protein
MAASRSEMAAIILPAPISIVRREGRAARTESGCTGVATPCIGAGLCAMAGAVLRIAVDAIAQKIVPITPRDAAWEAP